MSALRIIDGDGHVLEDGAEISAFLPAPYATGKPLAIHKIFPPLDHFHVHTGQMQPGAFGGGKRVGPREWLEFLDFSGITASVLYPSHALSYARHNDRDYAIATTRAYNDWLSETYLKRSPRFHGMALIPIQDPDVAVEELRRAVTELGMRGAMLPSNPLTGNLGSKHYWPIYREADRLGCALSVHSGVHSGLGFDDLNVHAAVHALGHPYGTIAQFAGVIFNGLIDRFPNVRWAFLEGGVAWVLFALERFDRSYETHVPFNPRGELLQLREGEKVSGYITRKMKEGRIFVGCEGEEPTLAYVVQQVGHEPFLYASDYPHEMDPEHIKEELHELLENEALSLEARKAIFADNAERYYRISATGEPAAREGAFAAAV